MKYQITNRKLNVILDELAEEYKDLLVEATLSQKNEIDIDNISISDLTKIDIETKERLKNRSKNYKISRISYLVSMIGLIYSLIGLMLMLVSGTESNFYNDPLSSVAIVCVFIGFVIAIFGMMIKLIFNNKKIRANNKLSLDYEIQLINKWRIIESLIYQITPQNDRLSLRSMINNLEQSKFISKEDIRTLNILMHYRNLILHNSPGNIELTDEIKDVLEESQELIEKLSEII